MTSSTTLSTHKNFTYDVFISFRGDDTRKNFVDHLYFALQRKNILAYKDDERIKKGKKIIDELLKSIEDSRFYIIVFSKNYASSSWCLDELVKIMECQRTTHEHVVYPIFYDVEPFEVRKLTGVVGKSFAKHKKHVSARKWREALREAAELAGWELKNNFDGHEAEFIQNVVDNISIDLCNSNVDGKLKSNSDIHVNVMKKTGGGVKETLARVGFDRIGKSFVKNVRIVQKPKSESYQNSVIELTRIQHEKK
ncbi:hypothetical protein SSX86_015050 [Deinandra increscens subsp. villosa]|uniref:TIR domain-containing protein n=1 Tax=Deinandra increscens subsp. villosa TaxID=3103831 RepID=A0AAP0D6L3_9ASTR